MYKQQMKRKETKLKLLRTRKEKEKTRTLPRICLNYTSQLVPITHKLGQYTNNYSKRPKTNVKEKQNNKNEETAV